MATKVTIHFRDERVDRATYISQTVGFGAVVNRAEYFNRDGMFSVMEVIETGVVVIRGNVNQLVTMYIARPEQLVEIYKQNRWGKVPMWLMNKAKKNWQKGYTKNQTDYH